MGTKRYFIPTKKNKLFIFTRYRSKKIDHHSPPKFKSSYSFALSMRMEIFRVKIPSCKILKTKNCVPFELKYYNNQYFWDRTSTNNSPLLATLARFEPACKRYLASQS